MPATMDQLDAHIDHIIGAPSDSGTVEPVVARPSPGERIVLESADRFGIDSARWINSRRDPRLRGIRAGVIEPGTVGPGDSIRKI